MKATNLQDTKLKKNAYKNAQGLNENNKELSENYNSLKKDTETINNQSEMKKSIF